MIWYLDRTMDGAISRHLLATDNTTRKKSQVWWSWGAEKLIYGDTTPCAPSSWNGLLNLRRQPLTQTMMNCKECGRKTSRSNLRCYLHICLERLKKKVGYAACGPRLEPGTFPEYESGVLSSRPQRSVFKLPCFNSSVFLPNVVVQ
jgi:hypothetical protein